MNPINSAILQNDFTTAQQLLEQGESWNLDNFMATQAYERLLNNKQFDLLNMFIENEHLSLDIFEYDSFTSTIFESLTRLQLDDELLTYLNTLLPQVENIDDDLQGINWLGLAIKNNADIQFIEKLVENGCDINYRNSSEQTLLFLTENIDLCNFLLNSGVDVNTKDNGGNTALKRAVASENTDLITAFLDFGADPNSQNIKGETVYHTVVFETMKPEIYQLLAQYDPPRFDLLNKSGQSLFFQFIESSNLDWEAQVQLFELMLADGADLFQSEKNSYGEELTAADLLSKKSFDLFKKVIEMDGFDANQQDNKGNTWLHLVAGENLNFDQQKAKVFYQKIKALLKLGANPSLRNDQDKTPIDLASDDNLKAKGLALLLKQ